MPSPHPVATLGRSCLTVVLTGLVLFVALGWALYTYARPFFRWTRG